MFQKLLIIQLIFLSSQSQLELESSSPNIFPTDEKILKRSKRVVGGYPTNIETMPYMVNIRRDGHFECGGSLITPKCVLTAAHCIKTGTPENFMIRGGNTFLSDERNNRRVKQIFKPEFYDNKTLSYDIAIFELQKPFKPWKGKLEIIKLATKKFEMPTAGDFVRVSGWGLTRETATEPSNQLRTVEVNVLTHSKCQKLYENYRNVTETMFCASVPGKKDACSADSGGPAVFRGKLVGVVSWGKGYECARSKTPGVYVNIVAVGNWINSVLRQACW